MNQLFLLKNNYGHYFSSLELKEHFITTNCLELFVLFLIAHHGVLFYMTKYIATLKFRTTRFVVI